MKKGRATRHTPKYYMKSKAEMNLLQNIWHFIWHDDSLLSWLANIVLAFILIKFIIYPLLALALGSQLPVVAVITSSMDHHPTPACLVSTPDGHCLQNKQNSYLLCGNEFIEKIHLTFDDYWNTCGDWYIQHNITKNNFSSFKLSHGFRKGDVIVLGSAKPEKLHVGDVLVFNSNRAYPIIHRIVAIQKTPQGYVYTTKGDHNAASIDMNGFSELHITQDQVIGRGLLRLPLVGYLKLLFVDLLHFVGIGGA